jgi:hypothetical protein
MKTTACSCTEIFSRVRLITVCRTVALAAVTFALACSNAGAQGVMKTAPVPNPNITLAGPQAHRPSSGHALPGKVEGFVYWNTHSVTYNAAQACSGFSVSVIAGGNVLAVAPGQFGAKPINQVNAFLANGTIEVYDVCTYAYDNLPENASLRVELNITQPGAFSPAVAPSTAIVGPLTIINGRCNMLPDIATATLEDLTAHWGSCQDMAFDVNFQLAPASAITRTSTLQPRSATLLQNSPGASAGVGNSSPGGMLANPATQTTMLSGSQGGTAQGVRPLVPRGNANGNSDNGSGNGTTGLQPLFPRGSANSGPGNSGGGGGSSTGSCTATRLRLEFVTGGDDLRGGKDNLNIVVYFTTGEYQLAANVNKSQNWPNGSTNFVDIYLDHPVPPTEIRGLRLVHIADGGFNVGSIPELATLAAPIALAQAFQSPDNWNMNKVVVAALGNGVGGRIANYGFHRFTGSKPDLVVLTHVPSNICGSGRPTGNSGGGSGGVGGSGEPGNNPMVNPGGSGLQPITPRGNGASSAQSSVLTNDSVVRRVK